MSHCNITTISPATKIIGWIGIDFNLYQLVLMGTRDDDEIRNQDVEAF